MPTTCGHCSNNVTAKQKTVICSDCKLVFHINCVNNVGNNGDSWICENCTEPTLKDILNEIRNMAKSNQEMKTSIIKCHESVEEIYQLIKKQDGKIQGCMESIQVLESKCDSLKEINNNLLKRLNNQEQNSRLNSVEIMGIPVVKEENLISVVFRLCKAINFNVDNYMIDSCYRLKKNPNKPAEPPTIFLKFSSHFAKDEFMKAKKIRRILNVKDVDESLLSDGHNNFIYVNHSLTQENKILLMKCNKFKKENNIKFTWVKNGKIFMRRDDKSKVFIITQESDLNDVR